MSAGYICVAGIEKSSNAHVRPVIPRARLRTSLLRRNGGLFDIATEVDLGAVSNVGKAPELEDRSFDPSKAQVISEKLSADEFWALLNRFAQGTLKEIFGTELAKVGRSAALTENTGQGSLGCILPASRPQL